MYLLDTNICVFAIRNNNQSIFYKISERIKSRIYVSSLTIAEMEFGISNSMYPEKNRMALLEFISIFEILNFTEKDAIPYGMIKTELRRSGQIIGPIDMLLAGQAISNNLILITNNTKEFSRIKDLKIEDWSLPSL